MTPPESQSVAVELAQLRGELSTGLAEIKGSLAVMVERSQRTERDMEQLREDTDADITGLRAEVEDLKRRVWTASGAVIVVSAAAGYGVQFLAQ